jgi:hypothetical protein
MCSTPKGKGIREVMFTETRQRRRKRIRLGPLKEESHNE